MGIPGRSGCPCGPACHVLPPAWDRYCHTEDAKRQKELKKVASGKSAKYRLLPSVGVAGLGVALLRRRLRADAEFRIPREDGFALCVGGRVDTKVVV